MAIVNGIVNFSNAQIDGRYSVLETWTDDRGNSYQYSYMSNGDVLSPQKSVQAQADAETSQSEQGGE